MSTVTHPIVLDETFADKMDEVIAAIGSVSLGNYVIVNINNYTWGSVTGAGVYPNNTPVTLRATPKTGCYFLAWKDANGQVLSINSEYTFTPSGNTVISADFNADEYIKCVNWATGTDVELAAMLSAHYRGVIDIHDYWSVGDTRTVSLSAMGNEYEGQIIVSETHAAQDVQFVLMDETLTGITPTDAGIQNLAFSVGLKDSLQTGGLIGSWSADFTQTSRSAWCNNIFSASIPANFLSLFKHFSQVQGKTELFSLPRAEYTGLIASGGYNLWDWYLTAANRIKKRGISGTDNSWWTSTPLNQENRNYYAHNSSGAAHNWPNNITSQMNNGLSPFGCI